MLLQNATDLYPKIFLDSVERSFIIKDGTTNIWGVDHKIITPLYGEDHTL